MHRLMPTTKVRRFLSAQDGTTAIEYSIIAAGIGVALIGAFAAFGDALLALWTRVATALA
jgi:pilus assembly protein Flp/PilA